MKSITQKKLAVILKKHKLWLDSNGIEGKRADLREADLRDTDLREANLRYANLRGADLRDSNLRGANLRYADLRDADLRDADLRYADLRDATLRYADLRDSNLRGADLKYAKLSDADLRYADLRGADLQYADLKYANLRGVKTDMYTTGMHLACPEEGSFIAYKKASKCLIKLLVLDDSKRSSATSLKCRCDKAKVLNILNIENNLNVNEVISDYDNTFVYEVGKIVSVDNFDNDRWNECSTGIHFFINKENALTY